MKKGRLSIDEKNYIRDHASLSSDDIAKKLDRDPNLIKKFLTSILPSTTDELSITQDLRDSQEWENLKLQFTNDELRNFEHKYGKIIQQFGEDVTETERLQIFALIKISILMDRCLIDRKQALVDLGKLQVQQQNILSEYPVLTDAPQNIQELFSRLSAQLIAANTASKNNSREYTELDARYAAMMKDLKATRQQRVAVIENSKENIMELIKRLQDREHRNEIGIQSELLRLAGENEYQRLGQFTEFPDGQIDKPLLSSETIEE